SQNLVEIAEWELPDGVTERADWFTAEHFIAFMDRLEGVAHATFAEELRLAEGRVPAGTPDPPSHPEAAARPAGNNRSPRAREKLQDLIANLRGTALVGIQAENPIAAAGLDGTIA